MEYTTFDIVKNLGIKQERLREWIDRGFIEPSLQKASGRGTKNLFSRHDLYRLGLFIYLLNVSLSRERAAELVNSLPFRMPEVIDTLRAITVPLKDELAMPYQDGTLVFCPMLITDSDNIPVPLDGMFSGLDGYLVVNFTKIKKRIDAAFAL
jgi:DNA-binding transcriptional MerR regulator